MNTAIINIKVTPEQKKQAQAVADSLGIPLSNIIKGFLTQLVRTKTITFSAEEPTPYLIQSLKESEEDVKQDNMLSFESGKDALNFLDKEIENDKRHSN